MTLWQREANWPVFTLTFSTDLLWPWKGWSKRSTRLPCYLTSQNVEEHLQEGKQKQQRKPRVRRGTEETRSKTSAEGAFSTVHTGRQNKQEAGYERCGLTENSTGRNETHTVQYTVLCSGQELKCQQRWVFHNETVQKLTARTQHWGRRWECWNVMYFLILN